MSQIIKQWMLVMTLILTPVVWANEGVPEDQVNVPMVNLNTDKAEVIAENLQGIGLAKAQAIVAYREKHGDFVSVDELTAVRGVGEKTLAKNADRIRLQ